jgi:catechol 2,3-dioxygenase-like lactoylglutathione lyase family enzyme
MKISIGHIDHLNLSVKSLKDSVQFYSKLFGLKVKEEGHSSAGNPYVIIGSPNSFYLCLYENPGVEAEQGPFNHFGIHVEDWEKLEKILEREGIEVKYDGVINYPNSKSIYIDDPNGLEIELSSKFGGDLQ